MENTEKKLIENVEYTIKEQKAYVIRQNGEKDEFTIISKENYRYYAVDIVNNVIKSEFEVYKVTSMYKTYYEKLEKDKKPYIRWGDDYIYPQDSEWWQPNYSLKVFTEYDWGGGYWKTYTLQEYLELRASYGTRSDIQAFAEFFDKLANIMVYLH